MIDITRLNPAELDRFIHLQALVDRQNANHERVHALRNYYSGNHPVLLTARQQEFIGDLVTDGDFTFAHNLVKSVVDTLRERIDVSGFTVNGDTADDIDENDNATGPAQVASLLWDWWTANRMNSQQIRLYRRALRDGASYVIVDFDSEANRPRLHIHKVDDGATGVTLHRDPTDPNRVLFANRYFYTYDPLKPGATGKARKTTYLPGEIRKYIRNGIGQWEQYDAEDNGMWPLPWRDAQGNPLGIPVFEFENPGGSEITQIIGLQNALNKAWLDFMAALDMAGFPVVVVNYMGDDGFGAVDDDADIEGADEFRIGPGRAIEVDNADVKRIEAANLAPMIESIWTIVAAVSGVSRTPQYYLRPIGGAEVPSGESLKQLESGLVKRAEERHLMFGQAWTDVMGMAVKVATVFGSVQIPDLGEEPVIEAAWVDANVRNELSQAQTAEAHARLNVPDEEIWTLLGYSPEKIASFKAQARAERAAEVAAIAASIRLDETRSAPQTNPATFGSNGTNGTGT